MWKAVGGGTCKFKQTLREGENSLFFCFFFFKGREMLTDETGGKGREEALNSLCIFPTQTSRLFCLFGDKVVFMAWHHVFCVLFEGEDCHNKKKGTSL